MKTSIFTTPRRGLMGSKSLGAEYMPEVTERAKRLQAVSSLRDLKPATATDNRQQRLPGF
jgi:hypothetical protein